MHRLDQDTSGCLLFARNAQARAEFQKAFEARQVEKYYLAVVDGVIDESEGVIDLPLAKISSRRPAGGWSRPIRAASPRHALAGDRGSRRPTPGRIQPVTGRTHQIRVPRARGFGLRIVGDPRLWRAGRARCCFTRGRLVVPRDGKPTIDVTAPLPDVRGLGLGRCGLRT